MYYDCLGGNSYRITLKVYRDCYTTGANFDDPLILYIYNAAGVLVQDHSINFPGSTVIDADLTNPCMTNPPDICVEEAIYEVIVSLPNSPGGYDVVYQRCCRNSSIINLDVPDSQGATYWNHIPNPGDMCNSSPRFENYPPIIICGGYPFEFDHSAYDPDGDSLVYELCAPFLGGSFSAPTPSPGTTPPISPPPYPTVDYSYDFTATYPMDADPPLTINPNTGYMTATPEFFGQYVVGVCVKEYRDGVLIGTHLRDFQFNVTDCTPPLFASFPEEYNNCNDMTILFDNNSFGTSTFYWDFGVPGTGSDFSSAFEPTYTYPDTGTYLVMLIANPGTDCSDTAYSEVQIYPNLIASFNYESVCAMQPVLFDDGSVTTFGELVSWTWDFGDGSTSSEQDPTYVFEMGGTFPVSLKIKNDVGCVDEITTIVTVYPLPQAEFNWENICIGEEVELMDASVIPDPYFIAEGIWTLEGSESSIFGTEINITFDSAGLYTLTYIANSDKGCTDTITHYLSVAPEIVAELEPDTSLCEGDSIQLLVRNGSYYQWTPVYHISDANVFNPYVFPEVGTTYTVLVSDGCTTDTASIYVDVLPKPVVNAWPDTAVYRYEPVNIYADGDGVSFEWWPSTDIADPNSNNTIIYPSETDSYIVTATGENGCTNTDTISIVVWFRCNRFGIPNAFTPNNDGLNDAFRIVSFGDDAIENFSIYNRWGEVVFNTADITMAWDGNSLGKPQETGVYMYLINLYCEGQQQTLTGTVTLLR